jgi:hypothetical protein
LERYSGGVRIARVERTPSIVGELGEAIGCFTRCLSRFQRLGGFSADPAPNLTERIAKGATDMKGHRGRFLTAALLLTLVSGGGATAQADTFIPGYTDFPNALRQAAPHPRPDDRAIPPRGSAEPSGGVTRPDDRSGTLGPGATPVVLAAPTASGGGSFDWADGAIGAATATGVLLLSAGAGLLALRRRGRLAL